MDMKNTLVGTLGGAIVGAGMGAKVGVASVGNCSLLSGKKEDWRKISFKWKILESNIFSNRFNCPKAIKSVFLKLDTGV